MVFYTRPVHNDASFNPLFRLLEDFDKYSKGDNASSASSHNETASAHWQPRFDVRETPDAYHLHGELPGVSRDQISIEFPESQNVTIHGRSQRNYQIATDKNAAPEGSSTRRGSHQATVEDETDAEQGQGQAVAKQDKVKAPADEAKYWLSERSIGEFSRTFTLPSRVDEEATSANLRDGILTVVIPKAKKYESRRIVVN